MGKTIPEKQLLRLVQHGSTIQLSGFLKDGKKMQGKLYFDDNRILQFKVKETALAAARKNKTIKPAVRNKATTPKSAVVPDAIPCPKCQAGKVLKGKTAYGCSRWKEGCDFLYSFDRVRDQLKGQSISKALVWEVLKKYNS